MQIEQRTTFIHADDFGITPGQAKAILSLSSSCGGVEFGARIRDRFGYCFVVEQLKEATVKL